MKQYKLFDVEYDGSLVVNGQVVATPETLAGGLSIEESKANILLMASSPVILATLCMCKDDFEKIISILRNLGQSSIADEFRKKITQLEKIINISTSGDCEK